MLEILVQTLLVTSDLCPVCCAGLSVAVAMLCSFLLGLGDSCFNTQLLSIIGFMFRDDSAPAFAAFRFTQVGAADEQQTLDGSPPSR